MITGFTKEGLQKIAESKDARLFLCEQSLAYFAAYYFKEYFFYNVAPFHWDFYEDWGRLMRGEINEAAWVAFRESAKTSIAKIGIVQAIAFQKKHYINWDSYDKANAEAALFDVTLQLQTNKRLIHDFGQLYYKKQEKDALREAQMKRIGKFVTENGIMVESFSTGESPRGRIFGVYRPDLFVFDDIETAKTKDSVAVIEKIKGHVGEARTGLGPAGSILYLGNYITEDGVIADVLNRLETLETAQIRFVPLIKHGKISWPDKYVKTDKYAAVLNKRIVDPMRRKLSIEERRRFFGKDFEPEMMNNPTSSEDYVFDRVKVRADLKRLEELEVEPLKVVGDFKIWKEYNPSHRYGGGGDVAEGKGLDSSATGFFDFSPNPAVLVGTYKNDRIAPNLFAHEMANQGRVFGECILAPELNNMGYATVAELREIYPPDKIYRRQRKDKLSGELTEEFGWRTTEKTNADIVYQFKSAYEDGELDILDPDVLREMLHFRKEDVRVVMAKEGMTRHFDLLKGCMIGWALKNDAVVSKEGRKKFRQTPYQSGSVYGNQ